MKILAVTIALALPALAQAEEEAFPISGSITSGLSFSHANFVEFAGETGGAGFTRGTLTAAASYSTPVKGLGVSASFSVQKAIDESFRRAAVGGGVPTQPNSTEITDISLGAGWGFAEAGPVKFTGALDVVIPTSNASRNAGLYTAIAPSLSAALKIPGGLSWSVGTSFAYNVIEAQVPLDCDQFPQQCEVLGGRNGLGQPNSRMSWGVNTGLGWATPLPGLKLSARYNWGNSLSAVEFPDDEFTSEFAQTGRQTQGDVHGTRFGLSYTPTPFGKKTDADTGALDAQVAGKGSRTAGATPRASAAADDDGDAIEPEPGGGDWGVLSRFTLAFAMSTRDSLYTPDGDSVTVPIFDFEADTRQHTNYSVSLTAAF